jgi:hypothetical protein
MQRRLCVAQAAHDSDTHTHTCCTQLLAMFGQHMASNSDRVRGPGNHASCSGSVGEKECNRATEA